MERGLAPFPSERRKPRGADIRAQLATCFSHYSTPYNGSGLSSADYLDALNACQEHRKFGLNNPQFLHYIMHWLTKS
jgi:hypothetical protein